MNKKYYFIGFFILIALVSSIIIFTTRSSEVCVVNGGCSTVQNSKYSQIFGIDTSFFGIFSFSILLMLIIFSLKVPARFNKKILDFMIFTGGIIALYFIILQLFVLRAYCFYCLIADFSMLIAFGINFLNKKIIFFGNGKNNSTGSRSDNLS